MEQILNYKYGTWTCKTEGLRVLVGFFFILNEMRFNQSGCNVKLIKVLVNRGMRIGKSIMNIKREVIRLFLYF